MNGKAVQLVIAIFEEPSQAGETLGSLKTEHMEQFNSIEAAVAILKDSQGKISYQDLGLTPGKGALSGVILGAVVGILSGGTGFALGALGSLAGGWIGKRKREEGVAAERVNQVVASLAPGSSALLAVVEVDQVAEIEALLHAQGADTFTADVSADLASQLREHPQAAYDALVANLKEARL